LNIDENITPLLRWVGGKNWLIKKIDKFIPNEFNRYYEPFIGGASVSIFLNNRGLLKKGGLLSDTNDRLINFYNVVKNNPEELVEELSNYKNTKEDYYIIRSYKYENAIKKAAQFYYLNRTSFNGIYRENLKGEYNVPYGNKHYKILFDEQRILNFSKSINNICFQTMDFYNIKNRIEKNDLIFLDPPYTVAHENNGFVKYNQQIFSWSDQEKLKKLVEFIIEKKAMFILTNAYHESIINLYKNIGDKIILERPSVVGGKKAQRTIYKELLITNIK